jgi:hypothetical protein
VRLGLHENGRRIRRKEKKRKLRKVKEDQRLGRLLLPRKEERGKKDDGGKAGRSEKREMIGIRFLKRVMQA